MSLTQGQCLCTNSFSSMIIVAYVYLLSIAGSQSNYFNANSQSQWEHGVITCNSNQPCTVICDENYSCRYSTITCPQQETCDILCNGLQSCREATINPPQDEALFNLTWTVGQQALYGVTYPLYPQDDNSSFSLYCGENQCRHMIINCPKYAKCNIACIGGWSCYEV